MSQNMNEDVDPLRAADISDAGDIPDRPKPGASSHGARHLAWALLAGAAAGLATWLGGEAAYQHFQPTFKLPANWEKLGPYDRPDVVSGLLRKARPVSESKNTAVAYGLLGALLAGALGVAGGLAQGTPRVGLVAGFVGLLAGAAVGAGSSVPLTHALYRYLDPDDPGMMLGFVIHAGIWVPVGAVAGIAFGMGMRGAGPIVRATLGGLSGALLGTMAFEIANALIFPLVSLESPIPGDRYSRLMAILCAAVFTALGTAVGVQERARKPAPSQSP